MLCALVQANQVGHLICGCCQITLMYAWGAQSVKCAVCNHVTPVNSGTISGPPPQGPPGEPEAGCMVLEPFWA